MVQPAAPELTTAPGFLPERIRHLWDVLTHPTTTTPAATALPDPVAGWLDRVAPADTVDLRGVRLRMHGEIRLGEWRPFTAHQVISRRGFIWAAEAGRGVMQVKGFDLYAEEIGEMDWRLLGLFPVMRQKDDDVTRSAAGRFAAELLVFTPFVSRSGTVAWFGATTNTAVATVETADLTHRITMNFDADNRLTELTLPRWGNPDGTGFREETFAVAFDGEKAFDGVILPASFEAGWRPGPSENGEGVFFRATIDAAAFF